jgi:hypothetical protein
MCAQRSPVSEYLQCDWSASGPMGHSVSPRGHKWTYIQLHSHGHNIDPGLRSRGPALCSPCPLPGPPSSPRHIGQRSNITCLLLKFVLIVIRTRTIRAFPPHQNPSPDRYGPQKGTTTMRPPRARLAVAPFRLTLLRDQATRQHVHRGGAHVPGGGVTIVVARHPPPNGMAPKS